MTLWPGSAAGPRHAGTAGIDQLDTVLTTAACGRGEDAPGTHWDEDPVRAEGAACGQHELSPSAGTENGEKPTAARLHCSWGFQLVRRLARLAGTSVGVKGQCGTWEMSTCPLGRQFSWQGGLRFERVSVRPVLGVTMIQSARAQARCESRAGPGIGEKTSGLPRQGPTTGSGLLHRSCADLGGSGTVLERSTADTGEAPAMRTLAFGHRPVTRVRPGSRRCRARDPSAGGCE